MSTPRRVRLFFINCPRLDVAAASHLLLAQNAVQNVIQFELYHFWVHSRGRKWKASHKTKIELKAAPVFAQPLMVKAWYQGVKKAIDGYDTWLNDAPDGAIALDCTPAPSIVITETPLIFQEDREDLADRYLSDFENDMAIVSLAGWRTSYVPPTVLELLLANVQSITLTILFGGTDHFPTRGCPGDFCIHQPDMRISSALGWFCPTCEKSLRASASEREVEQLKKLIAGDWIGHKDEPGSVAYSLLHIYKYDLTRTKGFSASWWSNVPSALLSGGLAMFLDVFKWVAILLLTVWLASRFPNIAKFLVK